jgi:hypothetical protein
MLLRQLQYVVMRSRSVSNGSVTGARSIPATRESPGIDRRVRRIRDTPGVLYCVPPEVDKKVRYPTMAADQAGFRPLRSFKATPATITQAKEKRSEAKSDPRQIRLNCFVARAMVSARQMVRSAALNEMKPDFHLARAS